MTDISDSVYLNRHTHQTYHHR